MRLAHCCYSFYGKLILLRGSRNTFKNITYRIKLKKASDMCAYLKLVSIKEANKN